jgi:hypothetical protein
MKLRPIFLVLVTAATSPSLTLCQNQQYVNCRTLESSGNFVASNEAIVNGMVCQIAKPQTAVVASNQPSSTPGTSPKAPSSGGSSVITNARVIELSKLGLDDDIVIAKIRNGNCQFQLGDSDLVALKKAGVSAKVIAAMLESGSSIAKPETTTARPEEASSVASPAASPTAPGMYVSSGDTLTKIMGQILSTKRTGSLLVSGLSMHLKTSKVNEQLLGAHAQTFTGPNPQFLFIPAKQEADAGVNAGDLILIRMEQKKDRRQFEVGAAGAWRQSSGVALSHEVQLSRTEVRPGVYKIAPVTTLTKGEYGLYLSRGEGMAPYIYDFSVE